MITHLLESNKGGGAESVVTNLTKISEINKLESRTVFLGNSFFNIFLNLFRLRNKGSLLIHSLRILIVSSFFITRKKKKYFFSHFNYNKPKRILIRILSFRHQIVCVGNVGYNKFLNDGISQNKILLIHNVVINNNNFDNPKKSHSKPHKEFCWIGSIKNGKNWEHLFPIADCLSNFNQKIVINIYGTGLNSNKLQSMIKNYTGAKIKFIYHGYTDDVINVLRDNDLLIYTAYNNYEMAPMILLEAELTKTKVAAYRSDVNNHFFKDELPDYSNYLAISNLIMSGGILVSSNADLIKTKDFLCSICQ